MALLTSRTKRQRCCGKDRKSTRLNSSHLVISYAVFCLKKKKNFDEIHYTDRIYSGVFPTRYLRTTCLYSSPYHILTRMLGKSLSIWCSSTIYLFVSVWL